MQELQNDLNDVMADLLAIRIKLAKLCDATFSGTLENAASRVREAAMWVADYNERVTIPPMARHEA